MTIKQLLKLPSTELDKITEAQWKEYLGPYLVAVHPEEPKPEKKASGAGPRIKGKSEAEKTLDLAAKMAARLGIKLD